jgi:hypothetical protein
MLSVLMLSSLLVVGAILLSAYILTLREQRRSTSLARLPRRSALALVATLGLMVLAIWWLLHPVCVPLSDADVREFARWAPIETRTDRQLHGPVFQRRDGRWYQCKSWLSRQLFF